MFAPLVAQSLPTQAAEQLLRKKTVDSRQDSLNFSLHLDEEDDDDVNLVTERSGINSLVNLGIDKRYSSTEKIEKDVASGSGGSNI